MSDQKRITRSFWAVVGVGFLVLLVLLLVIRANARSTSNSLCRIDRGILQRQLTGTKQNRANDRFLRDNSTNPAYIKHFGALVPIQTGRISEIVAELQELGRCK